jgi:tetrahydromethanopterin S-methyltransferase subunit F
MSSRQDTSRARRNAARRKRYAEDPEYRERVLARNRVFEVTRGNAARKKRYAEDPEYRKRVLARNLSSRMAHRDEINARKRHRWRTDTEYRERLYTGRYGLSPDDYRKLVRQQAASVRFARRRVVRS